MSDELRLTDALTRLTDNGTTRVELVFHPQQDKYVGQRWQVRSGDARGVMTDRGWSPDDPAEALGQALGVPVVERDEAAELIAQLAECFRLSGADPDGNEDWRLARSAVAEVRQLREEYDELMLREEELVKALAGLVADLRVLMEDTEGVETYDGEGMPYTMNWARLLPGGKYEYLTHWNEALAALKSAGEL